MRRRSIAIAYDCLFPLSTGGGERQYRGFAEELQRRGFDVDYLTTSQWDDEPPQNTEFSIVPVTGPLALYDQQGVRRPAAALGFAWGLFRELVRRRRQYRAVIVSALPVLNVFAARLALCGSGTTVIVDYLEVWGAQQWRAYSGPVMGTVAWVLQKLAILLSPHATCHSQLSARRLRAEGLRSAPLVSPGLIDNTSVATFAEKAADPPFVLYAGRHISDKRVEVLPAAVKLARQTIPDLEMVILGTGQTTSLIREEVARADGDLWTDLPGFVSQEELDGLMARAACLANPSKREGYGLVVVEAAAHGTPVVLVSDEGNASTELVTDDVNGFVAASTNPRDLASSIIASVRGGADLRRRTRSWYEEAITSRTIERTVSRIVEVIGTPGSALNDAHPSRLIRREAEEGRP
ncbi:glycosyltransferase involved in cell wall biosynthesis [Microbacterium endophyticum]|uniref:D-inositol 3-phosphate glycosyltransferase n=1 Tax=Microbacterium endophyticum TaxID=1526412 RepID=A0A7W4YML9_9MICO|nr:glycosyltransferase family 4 protein [Microbacterium endophyticum]MBB2976343.1 glycosyltransferase involved in cell wall biosynthesis [Microbacterium endophyticum]NIK35223.1 glycosyltransferase involved in cell wall biosynthesis [Microbacterium endophyticum]